MTVTEQKFLLGILGPHKFSIIALIFISLLASVFDGISVGLLVPLLGSLQMMEPQELGNMPGFLRWVTVELHNYSLEKQIFLGISAIVTALVLKNIMLASAFKLGYWISTKISADLSLKAVNRLLTTGIDFHHKSKVGHLMVKSLNAPIEIETIVACAVSITSNVITFSVFILIMLFLSWQLFLITLVIGMFYLYGSSLYIKTLSKPSEKIRDLNLSINSTLQEVLHGIELIKSYAKESHTYKILNELIEKNRKLRLKVAFKSNMVNWTTDVLGGFAIALLFVFAIFIYRVDTRALLVILLPFLYIVVRLIPIVRVIDHQRASIIVNWPSLSLICDLLRPDDEYFVADGYQNFRGFDYEIKFDDVTFSYNSHELVALKNISLSIPKGKTTAIVGRSGSGKSTLIKLLLRYYDPQNGELLFDRTPLKDFRLATYRRKIGVVSQETVIFNNSVTYNIAFGFENPPSQSTIINAARKAGAHEFIVQLADGYDTLLGDRGVRLSGGQKQRISIARAILKDPEILILDEATSSLDSHTERQIYKFIDSLTHNRTVIVVAHRLSTVRNADQIVVLKNGRVVEIGSEERLLDMNGEFSKLSFSQ